VLTRLCRLDRTRIGEALATVDLTDRADDIVRTYSIEMKQQLGISEQAYRLTVVTSIDTCI
jgi:ABC-type multidrug transport system ATPase subunit